jgi:hypothetical protein
MMLLNIVAFKRTTRKFLNTLAVHIEGIRNPPTWLLDKLFRVNVPLKKKFSAVNFSFSSPLPHILAKDIIPS